MNEKRVFNFAAGPSAIPEEVLAEAHIQAAERRGKHAR